MLDNISDKFAGALLGLAIGDAMGSPVNGMSPYQIYIKYQNIDGFYACPKTQRGPGKYSGVAQTALLAANAAAHPEFDSKRMGDTLLSKLDKLDREWDMPTINALVKIREGAGYDACGDPTSVDGACLPRTTVAGLLGSKKGLTDGEVSNICRTIISISHRRKTTRLCAFIHALVIKELTGKLEDIEPPELFENDHSLVARLVKIATAAEASFGEEEPEGDRLWMRLNFLRKSLMKRMPLVEFAGITGNSGSCLDSLCISLYSFMRKPGEFACIGKSAELGGAAGLNAALTGAMLGAYKGTVALREDQQEGVDNASRIRNIAQELATM